MALFHTHVSKRSLFITTNRTTLFFSASSAPSSTDDPTVTTAVRILKHNRSKSRWTQIRQLFPTGFTPSQFSQITLHLRNDPHLALNLFNFTKQHSLCPHDPLSYATIIHTLARSRQKSQTLTIIQNSFLRFPPYSIFKILVRTYRVCDSAPFVFDLLIEACIRSKRIELAVEIARILRTRGVSPLVGTVNALIKAVCEYNGSVYGYDVYKEFIEGKKAGKLSVDTYNVLMHAFYKDRLVDEVERVWGDMVAKECVPNEFSYSVLMAVYCDDERMDEAMKVWEEMREKGLECDVVAYNTMIGGFCEAENVYKAEEFFKEMGLSGVESSCGTYECLISGYCKIGDIDSAMLLYKDMCRKGFVAVGFTVEVLIKLLCEKSMVSDALKVSRFAKKNNVYLKGESYACLIKGLCDEGKMEEGMKLQAEMVGRGFEPNSGIYCAFIDGYEKDGNMEMAGKLRMELLEMK